MQQAELPLGITIDPTVIHVNGCCELRDIGESRTILVRGSSWMIYDRSDVTAERLGWIHLRQSGLATRQELCEAFGVHAVTVARAEQAYRRGGVEALVPQRKGPRGPRVTGGDVDRVILRAKRQGLSAQAIARQLGIAPQSVHNALRRLGWKQPDREATIPGVPAASQARAGGSADGPVAPASEPSPESSSAESSSAESSSAESSSAESSSAEPECEGTAPKIVVAEPTELPVQWTVDRTACARTMDRILAAQGNLNDAAPLFEDAQRVRQVGVLLGIAMVAHQGVFYESMRVLQGIGPAFYGLRTSLVCLVLLVLLNLCRVQDVMRQEPYELGRLMGLDRSPERKTLRRKVDAIVAQAKSLQLMDALTRRRLRAEQGDLWLYVDGHVSVYTGKQRVRDHHVSCLRTACPSMMDYWVHQPDGDPLLVVTGSQNEGLVRQVAELLPKLRAMAPAGTLTVVFDREGWSPRLFAQIQQTEGVHFLSYRKAPPKHKLPELGYEQFRSYRVTVGARERRYELADTRVQLEYGRGKGKATVTLRQITCRKDSGRQVHVVTDDETSAPEQLAARMFGRWSQENGFKYARAHRGLDAMGSYRMEAADTQRLVGNPERSKLQHQIAQDTRQLDELYRQRGEQQAQDIAVDEAAFRTRVAALQARIQDLQARRSELAAQVPIGDTDRGRDLVQPQSEQRRFMHVLRVVAEHGEWALLELLRPHFKDWRHEGRALMRDILHSSGNLRVTATHLHVEIAPQASPYKTRALAALCDEVSRLAVRFPGTNLTMDFTIASGRQPSTAS